jgi:hypothetical protein
MQNEKKNNFASYALFTKALLLPRIIEPLIPATQPTRSDKASCKLRQQPPDGTQQRSLVMWLSPLRRWGHCLQWLTIRAADILNIFWGRVCTCLKQYTTKLLLDMISGFRLRVDEVFPLQGRYTSSAGNCLPTFRVKANNYQQTLRNYPEERRHDAGDFVCQILFYRQI